MPSEDQAEVLDNSTLKIEFQVVVLHELLDGKKFLLEVYSGGRNKNDFKVLGNFCLTQNGHKLTLNLHG